MTVNVGQFFGSTSRLESFSKWIRAIRCLSTLFTTTGWWFFVRCWRYLFGWWCRGWARSWSWWWRRTWWHEIHFFWILRSGRHSKWWRWMSVAWHGVTAIVMIIAMTWSINHWILFRHGWQWRWCRGNCHEKRHVSQSVSWAERADGRKRHEKVLPLILLSLSSAIFPVFWLRWKHDNTFQREDTFLSKMQLVIIN